MIFTKLPVMNYLRTSLLIMYHRAVWDTVPVPTGRGIARLVECLFVLHTAVHLPVMARGYLALLCNCNCFLEQPLLSTHSKGHKKARYRYRCP